jgi:hypothetical protein
MVAANAASEVKSSAPLIASKDAWIDAGRIITSQARLGILLMMINHIEYTRVWFIMRYTPCE